MIQSRIDYCSQLWSPSQQCEINKIEDLQRQFTKRIDGMEDMEYHERLKKVKMYSPELDILPFLVDQWSRKIFNLFKKVRKIIGENNLFYLSHDRNVIYV